MNFSHYNYGLLCLASFNRDYKFYDPIGNQASIRTQATVTGMIIPEPRPSLSVPDGEDYGSEGTKENSNFTRCGVSRCLLLGGGGGCLFE